MVKILFALSMLLSICQTSFASDADDAALRGLLELAAANNPAIGAAAERVEQARADAQSAAADLGPRLTGALGARWNDDEPASYVTDSYRNTYTATLSLIQTLYAGGSLRAGRRAAELALAAAGEEAAREYQKVMVSVRSGYYDLLRASAQLRVRGEALELAQSHLKQTEALYGGGMVPMGDVLRVQVSVSQAEIERIRAASAVETSWHSLERAVGVSVNREEISAQIDKDETTEQTSRFVLPADGLSRALERRPEMKAYAHYKQRADQLVRAAAGEGRPRVQAAATAGNTDGSFFPSDNDDWYVSLNLEWTLYDGGKARAAVRRAKAAARELLHRIDDLSSQIALEVGSAEEELRSAMARCEVARGQMGKAEEDYSRTIRRYEAQMSTVLDVLDSRMALIDSRTEYVNAACDIAAAHASLIYALGEDAQGEKLRGGKQ